MVCVGLFLLFVYKPMNEKEKVNLGWVIIALIIFSCVKNFCVVIYFGFISARKQLREMFGAEDDMKDSAHTSDNESDTIESIASDEVQPDPDVRPDAELLQEIQREQQMWNQGDVFAQSALHGPPAMNPYPTMIYLPQ